MVRSLRLLPLLSLVVLATCCSETAKSSEGNKPKNSDALKETHHPSHSMVQKSRPECENTEECERRCNRNDGQSCLHLGLFLEEAKNFKGAMAAYDTLCDTNDPMGCLLRALNGSSKTAAALPQSRPQRILEEGCFNDSADSCWALSLLHGVRPNIPVPRAANSQSVRFLSRACDLGYALACQVYAEDTQAVSPKKSVALYKKSVDLFERDCKNKNGFACQRASALLVPELAGQDRNRADDMYQRWRELMLEDGCHHDGIEEACKGDFSVLGQMMWGKYTRASPHTIRASEIGVRDLYWPVPSSWEVTEITQEAIRELTPTPPPPPRSLQTEAARSSK